MILSLPPAQANRTGSPAQVGSAPRSRPRNAARHAELETKSRADEHPARGLPPTQHRISLQGCAILAELTGSRKHGDGPRGPFGSPEHRFWAMTKPMSQEPPQAEQPYIPRLAGDGPSTAVIRGEPRDGWRDTYHRLLTMPLAAFLALTASIYLTINLVFGLAYYLVGGVAGLAPHDFVNAFFFSVETISTVGYGEMAPKSVPAHLVMTVESFIGLIELAITTGLLFARFSRPTARVMFSDWAVVTDYEGAPTLIFRAANRRRNRIVEADVSLTLIRDTTTLEGVMIRRLEGLTTLRSHHPVFYLTWQIMHRIDESSPLYGETAESLAARRAEILVVLKGLDETFAQIIHARSSYTHDRIAWNARLADIFSRLEDGRWLIDYSRFHDIA
jgi:inward rectifier potassium channel